MKNQFALFHFDTQYWFPYGYFNTYAEASEIADRLGRKNCVISLVIDSYGE